MSASKTDQFSRTSLGPGLLAPLDGATRGSSGMGTSLVSFLARSANRTPAWPSGLPRIFLVAYASAPGAIDAHYTSA